MAYRTDLPDLSYMYWLRDFDDLDPTDIAEVFVMEHNYPNEVSEWLCRIVFEHGRYSMDKPIVEFYSMDTNQFVSAYYVETLLDHTEGYHLSLDGGIPAWSIRWEDLADILDWLDELEI